jgi:peptidoglycan hydrolase-like protein with peptidoglycan-binding domain
MKRSFFTATTLAAVLAAAPVALAQSHAQMGAGGSTPDQSGAANGSSTGNSAPSMQTAPNSTGTAGSTYSQGGTSPQGTSVTPSGNTNSDENGQGQQLSQDEIQSVQQQLQQQGFFKNAKVDGRWGPRTRHAVESFQQAKGLPATGQLNQQTLDALGVHQGG